MCHQETTFASTTSLFSYIYKYLNWRLLAGACYLSCFTFLTPLFAQSSQDFAPIGAIWSDPKTGYYMQVTKDTTIADLPAVKIEKFWPWECNGSCSEEEEDLWNTRMLQPEFIHTSGSKVFHWVVDSFYLLYDFDLLPGDMYTVYSRKGLLYPEEKISFQLLVFDTASITVDGFKLRGQRLSDPAGSPPYAYGYYFTGWTYEKLGKEDYLFPFNGGDTDIFGYPAINKCYKDMDISFSQDNACTISPTLDLQQTPTIRIYPNPSSGVLFFDPPLQMSSHIEIYSMDGLSVFRSPPGAISGALPLNGMPPGSYYLQITTSTHTFHKTVVIN